ncbi:hypothetical protein [Bradyrhizobium sp. LTSP849]|uniref:hypothetical protein n=1 Tax=Bradyrhizobium sp. LTSP849 TaxID=1615890 RepID=UPI000A8AE026|nr:hypothetical protein [Bradyrhizobium sp. LTSP849]
MKKHDPEDLEVSVIAAAPGGKKWRWRLSIANAAPVAKGTATGTRDQAILAAQEARLRLISKGRKV